VKVKVFDIQNLAVAYVCFWATSPFLAYGLGFRLAAVAAVGLWAVLEMFRPGGIFTRPTLPVILTLFYIGYTALAETLLGPSGDITQHVQIWIMLFFLIFYESRRHDVRSMSLIFWVMLATLPIWFYTTYTAFDTFGSHAARYLTRSSDLARELTSDGVGGYSLIYSIVVLLPILMVMLLNIRRFVPLDEPRFLRPLSRIPFLVYILVLANLVLGFAVVVRAGFSIAIVLAVFSISLSLLFKRRSPLMLMMTPLMLMFAWLMYQMALIPLLEALRPLTEGTSYHRKLLDVIESLRSEQGQGTLDDRLSRYGRSIDLFIRNPIFGVISDRDVGKHSAYLDAFARYGVLIGSVFVYLLTYLPVRMMRGMRDNFGLAFSVFGIMVALPLLNDVFASLGVMLFILVPVACDLVERARTKAPKPRRRRLTLRWGPRPDQIGAQPARMSGRENGRA
tara:strand:+ start:10359 stop:11708 length:1350 start_codon:yes stop_codon:yes gene_type:complete